jgi:hypothetical protein
MHLEEEPLFGAVQDITQNKLMSFCLFIYACLMILSVCTKKGPRAECKKKVEKGKILYFNISWHSD